MLRAEGARACVVDVGLAWASGADPTTGTARAGTVPYLSPEQVAGSAPDVTSDLFSLGAMLYELATGQPPFRGTYPEIVAQIANNARPVTSASLIRDGIPVGLCKVPSRLLEKDRAKRYPSAAEALGELGEIASEPEGRAELGKLLGATVLHRRGLLHATHQRTQVDAAESLESFDLLGRDLRQWVTRLAVLDRKNQNNATPARGLESKGAPESWQQWQPPRRCHPQNPGKLNSFSYFSAEAHGNRTRRTAALAEYHWL